MKGQLRKINSSVRHQSGSTLFLVLSALIVLAMVVVASTLLNGVVLNRTVVKNDAERFALETALRLNKNDYAGRMNVLTAHSRELVFESRQLSNKVNSQMPELASLANHLMEQSRNGSKLIEEERGLLGGHIVSELNSITTKFDEQQSLMKNLPLVGGHMSTPSVLHLEMGDIEGMPSNVEVSGGNSLLASYDNQMGYLDPANNLYKANLNLKLPNQDADLNFEMSALPSHKNHVQRETSAAPSAALCSSKSFITRGFLRKDGQTSVVRVKIPSAIRCALNSKVGVDKGKTTDMLVDSAATTNGTHIEL